MSQAIALETLIRALESIRARYLIGGSVASSSQGLPRATLDTDLLVEVRPHQVASLARALGGDWYVDTDFARQSVLRGRAFNLIHIPTGHKFDLFPANGTFHLSELERATIRSLAIPGGNIQCFVATTEDMILAKLRWYRDGGEVSDRQWSDITGMLVVNRDLDFEYLNRWAKHLQVTDLLEKALEVSDEPI
jgi:hypothetical protein